MKHLTEQDKETIKTKMALGVPKTKIAKELGVSYLTINYHANPNAKAKANAYIKKYNSEHPDKFFKSQFFGLLKRCLKEKWVSKQEIDERILLIEQGLK